ncbi:hypothetical protein RSOLAG22IIIB_12921 [Rhizoctonia solani]|uniref:Uncharacterized protein n=1 Tax=Rhizoctonia solani TaxID=456999 RepID=A0A0K6GH69_9AGAM|nr:hypothetical protein RSOLAG22IIIB_12921 [Rhizoctonia solani]
MLRQLVCEGVSIEHIQKVIDACARGFGIDIDGKISTRSVGRIMKEGFIKAKMQVAYDLNNVKYFTICGDGTTIKNQQYEAKALHMRFQSDSEKEATDPRQPPLVRTLGVHRAVDHTAQTQLSGWVYAIESCCALFSRSPIGKNWAINGKGVARKLRGVLTDHAADQKRLLELIQNWKRNCDRELRGLDALTSMSPDDQLQVLWSHMKQASIQLDNWSDIPSEQRHALLHDAWLTLAIQAGEAEFRKLSPEIQFDIDFLAWSGCCMHKELNAVKGGALAMANMWENLNINPPMALRNKHEVVNLDLSEKVNDCPPRGAIKLNSLAGALFNNKDDKKGHQSLVDNYLKEVLAIELIAHREAYIMLLEVICDSKSVTAFTNIELNVYQALQDVPTLTELAVLCLHAQAIGCPYMRNVRRSDRNALDLGPLHDRVRAYCREIIDNPDLLLNPDVESKLTLDGQHWDRPDVIYRIQAMSKDLPYLKQAVVAFFEGELKTWERFTAEFKPGETIAEATQDQRDSAWNPATNDTSEGSLGQCRQMLRRAPNMTDDQRNARVMWHRNGTYDWSERALTKEDEAFVRREARLLDSSGESQKVRQKINDALMEKVAANRARKVKSAERKATYQERIASIQLNDEASYEELCQMKVSELDNQIDKLRESDRSVVPKSRLKTKQAKVLEIVEALRRKKEGKKVEEGTGNGAGLRKDALLNMEGVKIEVAKPPEDEEMYFDDEVCL